MNLLENYQIMGVINRTPNSFSDGGSSLDQGFFENQLTSFLKISTLIPDIGFESTAPMNQAISAQEEWERFNSFLEASKHFDFEDRLISFDTYKIENFIKMKEAFLRIHPNVQFILNDVSGVLDEGLERLITSHKHQSLAYIYTFTHIPSRENVQGHMNYVSESGDVLEECLNAFSAAVSFYKSHDPQATLILDPGFGFSKSYEQNWQLINSFESFSNRLHQRGIFNPILIGLSKKSFLKKFTGSTDHLVLEALQKEIIKKMMKTSSHQLLFRVHDPSIALDFK